MDASPTIRKAELERKKAKLAAIREEKKRKEEERRRQTIAATHGSNISADSDLREEADKMLAEFGIAPVSLSDFGAALQNTSFNDDHSTSLLSESDHSKQEFDCRNTAAKDKCIPKLEITKAVPASFVPPERICYSKTTQTNFEHADKDHVNMHLFEWDDEFISDQHPLSTGPHSPEEVFDVDPTSAHFMAGILPHVELVKPAEVVQTDVPPKEEPVETPKELSEEEKQSIYSSSSFRTFFERASKVIERAIVESDSIFVDYAKDVDKEKPDTSVKLSLNRCFYSESLIRNRCVTCFDFSPQYPELLAASYSNMDDSSSSPGGSVHVWNSKFKKTTPEYSFYCQSRVLSMTWAKFHPNLLIGGTYSGQICLWDNRHNKKTPIQKSSLSTSAHTHPVYCLQIVGSTNAHNIVSISSEGRLCSWSLEMLSHPQETLNLQWKQSKQVSPYCMCLPTNTGNNFFIGSLDGYVYSGCRHGNKSGLTELYEGHFGPVVGIDSHSAVGSVDFSHLFLTSSFDWTVKLWNANESRPLCSFENNSDYVFDVAWSPIHPALFACTDGEGRLDLWHLNRDTALPVACMQVENSPALNVLAWSKSGMQIVVGGDDGKTWMYDVNEQLACPTVNEWANLSATLQQLKQNQIEAQELNATMTTR
ncbi:Cytoplasmic dynein 1 intermediate chain 2 [Trichinella pseudospiralis]|uniref:Cytoplasmic dynein 1 intermediate chain 2 n=2 Tax=Trichinella pseudospiralis TaxID=6337 RepID=A0A0V1E6V7_TRIPS|nr:Cytoplasmic dynein 1 intermediate chain 2 [Trichinella pseudospiralis]KRY88513.1 Cytoplasmic dynein 1 intermediate chain 2 [Trichinella pseudospiralis]KRZ27713.1 Cytoplasmic dynein 1 intermediate chain 2 [Trichinella pseudospiralis]KRZ36679.1 Cytoplasmic dynein 1 intermediate chain 2 [Trichinella pseudospiralis]